MLTLGPGPQFPYALDALAHRLDGFWDSPDFASYRDAFPERYRRDRDAFEAHVRHLVAQDIKAPYLKALQGYLWRQGYESGDLVAPVFPDVGHFIRTAQAAGKKIIVYSSVSVPAQKLFFSHTDCTAIGPDALHLGLVRYRQRRPQDRDFQLHGHFVQ